MKIIFDEARSADIFYRCGFDSDTKCLYVEDGSRRTLWVPGFEYYRALKEVKSCHVKELKEFKQALRTLKRVEVPPSFPLGVAKKLRRRPRIKKELIPERKFKSAREIRTIKDAQNVARSTISLVKKNLRVGVTSERLKELARGYMISKGFDCPDIIVSSGKQTGQPHNKGSGKIAGGPVIVDVFPRSDKTKYWGDMTRTFIIGKYTKAEKMLLAVKKVQRECINMCTPGRKASAIHKHAVKRLEELGFQTMKGQGLVHALGHGVGLDIHEGPSISPGDDSVLKKGMVLTIEPGLYYDIGVRWEDVVVVDKKPRII